MHPDSSSKIKPGYYPVILAVISKSSSQKTFHSKIVDNETEYDAFRLKYPDCDYELIEVKTLEALCKEWRDKLSEEPYQTAQDRMI